MGTHCYREGATFPIEDPKPFCNLASCDASQWHLFMRYKTPSTCFEAKDPTEKIDLALAVLYAEGQHKISNTLYPVEVHDAGEAFWPFDEPLYPIPVGASVYYLALLAFLTTFYYTYLGRKILANFKNKLDLHPEANHFPNLPLYWIQQSKREADLRREVRNTWAWLARRYLLSPNDPLLANVDQVLGLVNWHDFEVSRTTWSLIKVILTVNALYVKVKRDRKEKTKNFEIIKDINLAKRKSLEDDPVQVTRVFEDFGDGQHHQKEKPKKPEEVPKKTVQIVESTVEEPSTAPTSASSVPRQQRKWHKNKPKTAAEALMESTAETSTVASTTDVSKSRKQKRKRRKRKKKPLGDGRWEYFYRPDTVHK